MKEVDEKSRRRIDRRENDNNKKREKKMRWSNSSFSDFVFPIRLSMEERNPGGKNL
jgi:hypothetical protein